MDERTCANCGRPGPIELEMKAKGGQVLTLISCSRCEARTWLADGHQVAMDEVLKITAGDADFTVTPTKPQRARTRR